MKTSFGWIAFALLALSLAACGGSSGSGSSGGTGLNSATSVTGTAYSPNGDAMPQVTVYVPGTTVSPQMIKATRSFDKTLTAADGTTCEDPPAADSSLAAACTGQDGTFSIDTSGITANPTQIVFVRGSLRMIQDLSCSSTACTLSSTTTTFGGGGGQTTWPRVAVVTGTWDRMEDVLAKLADTNTGDTTNGQYGRVDADGTVTGQLGGFVYGSEFGTNLTIIAGMTTSPDENVGSVNYITWDKYLDGTNSLADFDVVFINCESGTTYESLLATYKSTLQTYVNNGGRLYVTDLSYDYVEQPFPQVMKFEGDPDDATTAGALGDAQDGTSGVTLDAAIGSTPMSTWLGTAEVNRHDTSTPGNPSNDCNSGAAPYDQIASALTSGGLIPLGDFLSGWAQMVGAHTGQSPTIWISSGTGVTFDGQENRPLTVSMDIGSNGGRLIYSSYHTAHSCPSLTFWPQERVLQYLIFQAF